MLQCRFLSSVGAAEHSCGNCVPEFWQRSAGRRRSGLPRRRRTINLVMARGKIPFEVAQDALDRSSIQFSSKFLSLAKAHPDANQQAEGPRQLRVKIAPEYPTIAKQMKLKGAAQVEATIGRDGTVTDVRVLGGHPLLVDALVRAVKQWKYQPAAKDSTELIRYSFEPQ